MKPVTLSMLRVGKKFRLVNFGDVYHFQVMKVLNSGKYEVKDLYSLEIFVLDDVFNYGLGKDFELYEIFH